MSTRRLRHGKPSQDDASQKCSRSNGRLMCARMNGPSGFHKCVFMNGAIILIEGHFCQCLHPWWMYIHQGLTENLSQLIENKMVFLASCGISATTSQLFFCWMDLKCICVKCCIKYSNLNHKGAKYFWVKYLFCPQQFVDFSFTELRPMGLQTGKVLRLPDRFTPEVQLIELLGVQFGLTNSHTVKSAKDSCLSIWENSWTHLIGRLTPTIYLGPTAFSANYFIFMVWCSRVSLYWTVLYLARRKLLRYYSNVSYKKYWLEGTSLGVLLLQINMSYHWCGCVYSPWKLSMAAEDKLGDIDFQTPSNATGLWGKRRGKRNSEILPPQKKQKQPK